MVLVIKSVPVAVVDTRPTSTSAVFASESVSAFTYVVTFVVLVLDPAVVVVSPKVLLSVLLTVKSNTSFNTPPLQPFLKIGTLGLLSLNVTVTHGEPFL